MKIYAIDTGGGSTVDTLCLLATRELAEQTVKLWRKNMDVHDDGWDIQEREVFEHVPSNQRLWSYHFQYFFEHTYEKFVGHHWMPRQVSQGTVTEPAHWLTSKQLLRSEIHFEWEELKPKSIEVNFQPKYVGSKAYYQHGYPDHITGAVNYFTDKQECIKLHDAIKARIEQLVKRAEPKNIPAYIRREFKV